MTSKSFGNRRKTRYLKELPDKTIEGGDLARRCKFNFSYFDPTQNAGQDFSDWSNDELLKLINKIKHYTDRPLELWRHERCGSGSLTIYENYKAFPNNSDFTHPKHVPHNVEWARFRLENLVRLIGFVVPKELHQTIDKDSGFYYDANTFYVVFLDREHKFYLTEGK